MNIVANIDSSAIDEQAITDLQEAAKKLLEDSDSDFERLQNEPWYKRVIGRLAFTNKNGQQVAAQINTLMQAQICVIKILGGLSDRDAKIFDVLKEHAESIKRLSCGNAKLAQVVIDVQDHIKKLEQKNLGIYKVSDFRDLPEDAKLILLAILDRLAGFFDEDISEKQRCYLNWVYKSCNYTQGVYSSNNPMLAYKSISDRKQQEIIVASCLIYIELRDGNDVPYSAKSLMEKLELYIAPKHLEKIRSDISKAKRNRGDEAFMPKDAGLELGDILEFEIDIDFDMQNNAKEEFASTETKTESVAENPVENNSIGDSTKLLQLKEKIRVAKKTHLSITTKDIFEVSIGSTKYGFYFDSSLGEGFFEKAKKKAGDKLFELGRKSCLSILNKAREKSVAFIDDSEKLILEINRLLKQIGLQEIVVEKLSIKKRDYDLDNSVGNNDWEKQFDHCTKEIGLAVDTIASSLDAAQEQIGYLLNGECVSVYSVRKQKETEKEVLRQKEMEDKKTTILKANGRDMHVSIDWKKITEPPCEPEDVEHIETDGKALILVDRNGRFFCSSDGEIWSKIVDPVIEEANSVDKIIYICGTWIIFTGSNDPVIYSNDMKSWKKSGYPEGISDSWSNRETKDILFIDGVWLWRFICRESYEYAENGIISDSKRTSHYDRSVIYCAEDLGGAWVQWENSPKLPEGVAIDAIHYLSKLDMLLAFCTFNVGYKINKKKVEAKDFVKYFDVKRGKWGQCDWEDFKSADDAIIIKVGEGLSCFYGGNSFVSDKGYEWKKQEKEIRVDRYFSLEKFTILFSDGRENRVYFCGDNCNFGEIILDKGSWRNLSASNQGILSTYSPSKHETFLMFGKFNIS